MYWPVEDWISCSIPLLKVYLQSIFLPSNELIKQAILLLESQLLTSFYIVAWINNVRGVEADGHMQYQSATFSNLAILVRIEYYFHDEPELTVAVVSHKHQTTRIPTINKLQNWHESPSNHNKNKNCVLLAHIIIFRQ